ncbi:MAG TPA: ATP-binding protein [Myxococcota bacterium]|nr:ATP-binding protein [Myxococcota bacterium]HRY95109.1 ATP-binding protein [Myxococcota bacterium]HSA21147.1 ATP-binding protein [Myxococcota bacterium]
MGATSSSPPSGRPTQEGSERRQHIRLLVVVRSAVVAPLAAATLFFNLKAGLPFLGATQLSLILVLALVLGATILYAAWAQARAPRWGWHLQIQVVLDLLVSTWLVFLTNGAESPFTFLFALPIIAAALFFPRRGAMLTAGLACLLVGAMFMLQSLGYLPMELEGERVLPPATGRVVFLMVFHFAVFFAVAWLAAQLGEQLQRTGRELRTASEDLQALASLNRDIVQSLRSGLMAMDQAGRVRLLNPVAEEILGARAADSLGRPGVELLPPLARLLEGEPAHAGRGVAAVLQRVQVLHQRLPGPREVPVGLTLSALSRADGSAAGTLVHMQDLTELRALEAKMKKAERLAALGGMAAVLAHEIRNPLASISGSVQMLQRSSLLDGADRKLMEIILRETGRLDGLLGEFLAFARPKEPRRVECELHALVQDSLTMFARSELGGQLELVPELEDVHGLVDPDQIRQVLWNLLSNAAQALGGEGRGRIRVRLWRTLEAGAARVHLEVRDSGPGIPPELQERVFEPFFSTREKGTGLGLAVVNQIVEAHGGQVELDCPREGGCRVEVRLPGVSP